MLNLSKSKLIAYRQCSKRLWLEIHKPELRDDSASETSFQIGHQVGELAQRIFDPSRTGTLIDINKIGWSEAFTQSESLLKAGKGPVFEAAMRINGALALADVMLPDSDSHPPQWDMIEVKSSTSVKDYHRDDVAIQTYIAEKSGISLKSAGVAVIDNSFVYPGDERYEGLLRVEDVTKEARTRREEVEQWLHHAHATAALTEEPDIKTGPHCHDPFVCGFCSYCTRDDIQPECSPSILPRIKNKLEEWKVRGITELHETPDDELTEKQLLVKQVTLNGETFFDTEGARKALAPHGFPAWFLDFETVQFPIPIWKGTRPYEQLPFQYSLHRVEEDGSIHHSEFLDTSGDDPRTGLVKALVNGCGTTGPVYVYNAKFEKSIIAALANQYPEYASRLLAINERIVDLLPVARNCYYHPDQKGTWGLKAVLPGICPELSYDDLDGVHHGGEAVEGYKEAISEKTTPDRKREIQQQLLEYCRLDTLATVKIWSYFSGNPLTAQAL